MMLFLRWPCLMLGVESTVLLNWGKGWLEFLRSDFAPHTFLMLFLNQQLKLSVMICKLLAPLVLTAL